TCYWRSAAYPSRRQPTTFLQLIRSDPTRAQSLLRHPGTHAKGRHGCNAVANVVSYHPAKSYRTRPWRPRSGIRQGEILATRSDYPDERTANQGAESSIGWV